jgi:hypothetical protein
MPGETDKAAYDGIVDGFGQFRPGTWPEKINSIEMLRARGAEEAKLLAQWRGETPKRDRYGGLLGAGGFRATGFFRTERRDGRWWLVTPEGNPFFSIGMDVVGVSDATYVEGRELCSTTCRHRMASLPAIRAKRMTAAVSDPSAAASSITVAPSTFIPPISNANSARIGMRAGAKKHWGGSKPGASTRSAIGVSPNCRA